MADQDSKWALRIDVISYAVAALCGLAVLAVPLVFGGQTKDFELKEAADDLRDQIRKPIPKDDPREAGPPLVETLAKQWDPGVALDRDPRWITEIAPVLVRKIPRPPSEDAIHKAASVLEVVCERSAEKKAPVLKVKGAMSTENLYVTMSKVQLLRKEGEGEFLPVVGFSANGDFEYEDSDVKPGKTYTYQVVTTAVKDSAAPASVRFDAAQAGKQTSEPLGPTEAVPYDYSLVIAIIEPPKDINSSPKVFCRFNYWDYKQQKKVSLKNGQTVTFSEKEEAGEGNRYVFMTINDTDRLVVVRDKLTGERETFLLKDARTAARPVDCWAKPLTPQAAAGTGEEETLEEPEPEAPTKAAPASAKTAAEKAKAKTAAEKTKAKSAAEKAKDKAAAEKTKEKATTKKPATGGTTTKTKRFK